MQLVSNSVNGTTHLVESRPALFIWIFEDITDLTGSYRLSACWQWRWSKQISFRKSAWHAGTPEPGRKPPRCTGRSEMAPRCPTVARPSPAISAPRTARSAASTLLHAPPQRTRVVCSYKLQGCTCRLSSERNVRQGKPWVIESSAVG